VDATGTATAEITGDSAAALMRSIEADGFFDLDPRYIYGERGCGAYHTDAPHVTLTLSLGGRTHTVQHDYGCTGAPDVLRRMHDRRRRARAAGAGGAPARARGGGRAGGRIATRPPPALAPPPPTPAPPPARRAPPPRAAPPAAPPRRTHAEKGHPLAAGR